MRQIVAFQDYLWGRFRSKRRIIVIATDLRNRWKPVLWNANAPAFQVVLFRTSQTRLAGCLRCVATGGLVPNPQSTIHCSRIKRLVNVRTWSDEGRNVEDEHGEIAKVRYKYLRAISMTNLQGKEINWSWWTLVPQNRPIDYMLLPCL